MLPPVAHKLQPVVLGAAFLVGGFDEFFEQAGVVGVVVLRALVGDLRPGKEVLDLVDVDYFRKSQRVELEADVVGFDFADNLPELGGPARN